MAVFALVTVGAVSQRDILSNLTASYDASMRPGQALEGSCAAEAAPDRVSVETDVSVIHTINQVSKSYRLDGYLIASWSDPRLMFDASCQRLHFGAMKDLGIWAPQLNIPHARWLTVGGGSGKMAADGESVYIHPDGKVDWIRAMHVEMYCGGFSFGQLPYDIQYCDFSIASLGSSPQDLELYWLVNNEMIQMKVDADPYTSGEWAAHPVSRHSNQSIPILGLPPGLRNPLGATSAVTMCFSLTRSSYTSSTLTILVGVLLVLASWSGFFISPAAAPARVALAFLCFLMVLNNLNAVYRSLPQLQSDDRVWLSDFLIGTMVFNFFALLEYAAVNTGMRLKANLDKPDKPDKPASKLALPSSVQRRLADCARLDEVMRVFFPLAYFLYMGIMYAVLPLYPHNEGCIGI